MTHSRIPVSDSRVKRYSAALVGLLLFLGAAAGFIAARREAPADPFLGVWGYWGNGVERRARYLSITEDRGVYSVLRADSEYPNLASVARGKGRGRGADRRVSVLFPGGERYELQLNGGDELVVSLDRAELPEDITVHYFRNNGVAGE